MDNAENLEYLIKARYGSIPKFSKAVDISENTIRAHLKDGNWDRDQMVVIIRALKIPNRFIYLYFFESELAKTQV